MTTAEPLAVGEISCAEQPPSTVLEPDVRLRRSEKVLVCLIQALVGKQVMLELRKDATVRGVLDECDDSMNVMIKDATTENVEGIKVSAPLVLVRGSNIRFVHIPKTVDVSQAIEDRRLMLDKAAHAYLGAKGPNSAGGTPWQSPDVSLASSGPLA